MLTCLILVWIVSSIRGGRLHALATEHGRIESELAIYSSFALWIGVCVFMVAPAFQDDGLSSWPATLVQAGMVGILLSSVPMTRLLASSKRE